MHKAHILFAYVKKTSVIGNVESQLSKSDVARDISRMPYQSRKGRKKCARYS